MKHLQRHSVILILILSLLFMVIGFDIYQTYRHNVDEYKKTQIQETQTAYNATFYCFEKTAHALYHTVTHDTATLALLDQGISSNDPNLRNQLYKKLENDFNEYKKMGITQLYFHTPKGAVWLRMHKPHIFGDSDLDSRPLVKDVLTKRQYVSGFEEGRTFVGMRYVYPLYAGEKFLGVAEITVSTTAILSYIEHIYKGYFRFYLDKQNLQKRVWKPFWDTYRDSSLSSRFVVEKNLTTTKSMRTIIDNTRTKITPQLQTDRPFVSFVEDDVAIFLSLKNYSQQHSGWFARYIHDETLYNFYKDLWVKIGLTVGGYLVVLGLFMILNREIRHREKEEERLELALEGGDLGLWDLNWVNGTMEFNRRWHEMLGYSVVEHISSFHEMLNLVHPDDRLHLEEALSYHFRHETSFFDIEHRLQSSHGNWLWFHSKGKVVEWTKKGEPLRLVGVTNNITSRKENERRLELQARIIEQIHDAVIRFDKQGIIRAWNQGATRLFGYEYQEIIGQPLLTMYPEATPEFLDKELFTPLEKIGMSEKELHLTKKDGTHFWAHVSLTALCDENGNPCDIIAYALDITPQKEALEELAHINENLTSQVNEQLAELRQKDTLLIQQSRLAAMGEMISMIAHQWRQPLNTLGIMIQDVGEAYEFKEVDQGYIDHFIDSSMKQILFMSQTIEDFRNYFKPSHEATALDVSNVIEHVVKLVEKQYKTANVLCCIDTQHDFSLIGWKNELSQIILNLLNNARDQIVEKSSSNTTIDITITTRDDKGIIQICDHAGGIPDAIIDKIFDPYFSTKTEKNGTGLGLYMVKMIVSEHMKGTIKAYNSDDGAVFEISVPRA